MKSQNAFLTPFGDIRLGDFGLARQVRSPYTIFTDAGTDCCGYLSGSLLNIVVHTILFYTYLQIKHRKCC